MTDTERKLADALKRIKVLERLRELLADLTVFPERDCPDFYNALDAYDVAFARLS